MRGERSWRGGGSAWRRWAAPVAGALAIVSVGALGACQSRPLEDPFEFVVDPDAEPITPHGKLGYRIDWKGYATISRRQSPKQFEVMDDVVVVHDAENVLTVLDAATGRSLWSLPVGHPLERFLGNARWRDRLVVPSENEVQVFGLRSGSLDARHKLASLAITKPVVVDRYAVFGCNSGELLGHDLAVGFKAWGFMAPGAIRQPPTFLGGSDVGAVSDEGGVLIVDVVSGSARGRSSKIYEGVSTRPVGDEATMYVAGLDQSIWAYRRMDGKLRWRERTDAPIRSQPVLHDGSLYVTLESEGFTALNARTGDRKWSNGEVRGVAMAMRDGDLMVWDGRAFMMVDPETGTMERRVVLPDAERVAFDGFEDARMFTISKSGDLRAFSPAVR